MQDFKKCKMNFFKISYLTFLLSFLVLGCGLSKKINSKKTESISPPNLDFSFLKDLQTQNEQKQVGHVIEVLMNNGIPEYRIEDRIFSSLELLSNFQKEKFSNSSSRRNLIVDLKIDSKVPSIVISRLEDSFIQLNQLWLNYLNFNGDKLSVKLPPVNYEKRKCENIWVDRCCSKFDGKKFGSKVKIRIREGIYESVNNIYSTTTDCIKDWGKYEGALVEIKNDTILGYEKYQSTPIVDMNKFLTSRNVLAENPDQFFIILHSDENSSYETYLSTLLSIFKYYYQKREKACKEKYNMPLKDATTNQRRELSKIVPIVILRLYES